MYDKCYFCLDQLPKLKKESTASFFVNFGRSRGTQEPTYITVHEEIRVKVNKKALRVLWGKLLHFLFVPTPKKPQYQTSRPRG